MSRVASFILSMAFYSELDHNCENRWTGLCLTVSRVGGGSSEKIFSGTRAKLRRIASKTPKTRPIGQANSRDNVRIIPIKIHLK
jgi:hypothetical protein